MRNNGNFLWHWMWQLPLGVVLIAVGRVLAYAGALPDFWVGFVEGCGAFLALLGTGFLVTWLIWKRKKKT